MNTTDISNKLQSYLAEMKSGVTTINQCRARIVRLRKRGLAMGLDIAVPSTSELQTQKNVFDEENESYENSYEESYESSDYY
jgi:hypothetical protein